MKGLVKVYIYDIINIILILNITIKMKSNNFKSEFSYRNSKGSLYFSRQSFKSIPNVNSLLNTQSNLSTLANTKRTVSNFKNNHSKRVISLLNMSPIKEINKKIEKIKKEAVVSKVNLIDSIEKVKNNRNTIHLNDVNKLYNLHKSSLDYSVSQFKKSLIEINHRNTILNLTSTSNKHDSINRHSITQLEEKDNYNDIFLKTYNENLIYSKNRHKSMIDLKEKALLKQSPLEEILRKTSNNDIRIFNNLSYMSFIPKSVKKKLSLEKEKVYDNNNDNGKEGYVNKNRCKSIEYNISNIDNYSNILNTPVSNKSSNEPDTSKRLVNITQKDVKKSFLLKTILEHQRKESILHSIGEEDRNDSSILESNENQLEYNKSNVNHTLIKSISVNDIKDDLITIKDDYHPNKDRQSNHISKSKLTLNQNLNLDIDLINNTQQNSKKIKTSSSNSLQSEIETIQTQSPLSTMSKKRKAIANPKKSLLNKIQNLNKISSFSFGKEENHFFIKAFAERIISKKTKSNKIYYKMKENQGYKIKDDVIINRPFYSVDYNKTDTSMYKSKYLSVTGKLGMYFDLDKYSIMMKEIYDKECECLERSMKTKVD